MKPGVMLSGSAVVEPWAEGHVVASYTVDIGGYLKNVAIAIKNAAEKRINEFWNSLDVSTRNNILNYLGIDYFPKLLC